MNLKVNEAALVSITPKKSSKRSSEKYGKILLVKPPYFTPWTPPLGIAILKSYLEQHGYAVKCFDFNTDPELWGMHHKYFGTLQKLEGVSTNDGYSKLWWILNAHMLAYANDSEPATCASVLEAVIPLYGIRTNSPLINALIPLVDRFFKRLGEVIEGLDLSDYAVAGTSTYTTSLGSSLYFLKRLKQKYPHLTTVMGGGVFADDLALGSDNLVTLVENYPYVDHIILGEGELLFLKLLEGELAHKRVISIADLKGTTLEMKDVPMPDFSDLNLENYFHLTIEGARSCPFQCSFCSETIQWGDYRKKPIDLFIQQVLDLAQVNKNKSFFMGDSLMNPYLEPFSRGLLSRNADILYDGYLRADKPVTHRDKARNWARSGFYRARLGIESASARVLTAMDKFTTPQVISDALRTLANAGIRTTTYWIVGFPGETEEDFEETLEFVRENYRYIYELEAHPYYYYPYGQIGSRLYQCQSLYPDDVTQVIKFQVWDILDGQPTRPERYARLRQISSLASELGLPNIYTMADRYQAENRWLQLHPLATEVYTGTRLHRDEVHLPNYPVNILADEWRGQSREEASSPACVLSYRVDVKKKLDESILLTAVRQLIQSSEMLQMSLQDGKYMPTPVDEQAIGTVVHIYGHEGESIEDAEDIQSRVIGSLSAEMQPTSSASIRVVVINHGDDSCSLVLLAHRALFDSKSVVLLLEDLFRIYEQLSNGNEVSLCPVEKTYSDYINDLTGVVDKQKHLSAFGPVSGLKSDERRLDDSGGLPKDFNFSARRLTFEKSVSKRIFSDALTQSGFRPAAMMLSALISCFADTAGETVEIDIPLDTRLVELSLKKTVGALTRSGQLPPRMIKEGTSVREAQRVLEQAPFASVSDESSLPLPTDTQREPIFLNLEYFMTEPWLGGDEWSPQGFIVNESSQCQHHSLEIAPVPVADGVQVLFRYRDTTSLRKLVEDVVAALPQKLEATINSSEDFLVAKKFWLDEFGKDLPPGSALGVESDSSEESTNNIWLSVPFRFEPDLLRRLSSAYQPDLYAIILAAYGVLLSRLNGQEDLALVFCRGSEATMGVAPVRLEPTWKRSFAEFVSEAEQKSLQALAHGVLAFEILSSDLLLERPDSISPVFAAGYIFSESGEDGITAIERALELYPAGSRRLALVLRITTENGALNGSLIYRQGKFERESVEKLTSYFSAILEDVSRDVNIALGDIALTKESREQTASAVLAGDTFNFA